MKKQLLFLQIAAITLSAQPYLTPPVQGGVSIAQAQETMEAEAAQYTCPMHPHYISSDPNGTCPVCGMDLVPVAGGALQDNGVGISVAAEMIQTMGIRSVPAVEVEMGKSLQAFGIVEPNQRLETVSVSRVEGWIEDLSVRARGDSVGPGALLYQVYSPDLIAAQRDFLNALEIGNEDRIAAVRQRLRSLGMQTSVIDRLTQNRSAIERTPVFAEAGGIVEELNVREGDYINPGTPIMQLQSYSSVWVMASVPETDLPLIETGMPVQLDFPSAPQAPADGIVDYIYPTIDPRTRTVQLRIEVDNTSGALLPGAYADIVMNLGGTARLSVPTEAVLRDSRGTHVIISLGEGRFTGRAVETGINADGRTEILSGLEPGNQIVASGQFLLDSEMNLRESFAKLSGPADFGRDAPLWTLPIDGATLAEIDHFTDMALYFHEALTERYRIDPFFVDPALALGESLRARFSETQLVPILEGAEAALIAAKEARQGPELQTQLARLVDALEPWLLTGAPIRYRDAGVTLFKEDDTGRLWIQQSQRPRNPYGEAGAEAIAWPDPMQGMTLDNDEAGSVIDPHAGHR